MIDPNQQFPVPAIFQAINAVIKWWGPRRTLRHHRDFLVQTTASIAPVVTGHLLKLENEQMEIKKAQVKSDNPDISEEDMIKEMTQYESALTPYINQLIGVRTNSITGLLCRDVFPSLYQQPDSPPQPQPSDGNIVEDAAQSQDQNGEPALAVIQGQVPEGQSNFSGR